MSTLLAIQNLSIEFVGHGGSTPAVNALSLYLERGQTLGVVGESGSGKSTLALAIPRLLGAAGQVTGGRVLFDGVDLAKLDATALRGIRGRRIGMIFQEPMSSLHPMQTIGTQIAEGLRLHLGFGRHAARERAIALLDEVGLGQARRRIDSYPHQLSGGQRQRVMIAQALAAEPELLIADEPTTALDATTQRQVLDLLRGLQQRLGIALLIISHDLAMMATVADRLLVMRNGRQIETGPAERVLAAPRMAYTRALLDCRPRPRHECARLPVVEDDESVRPTYPPAAAQTAVRASGTLLEVDELVVRHHPRRGWLGGSPLAPAAVDRVSFSIQRGRTLGLLGESGSGKTTLGRALLRLIEPDAGSVRLDGVDVLAQNRAGLRRLRKRMQMVFQDPVGSLNPHMRIADMLCEPLLVHGIGDGRGECRDRAAELMRRVGLDPAWLGRFPHALSGGQRQRVGIARALAVEPELIICDESVSALDVSVQAQILNLLRDLQDQTGVSYLFISHDIGVIRFMADDIAVLREGRLLEIGEARALCEAPRHPYTRALLAATGG